MNRRTNAFSATAAVLLLVLPGHKLKASLILNDPLQGSTVGTRQGGSFVTGGWQVTGSTDCIFWHVPTITNGAVEFDVRGLYPNECRAGMADKVELFHMYDYTWNNSDYSYAPGYRDNPFKHFIRKTDCLDTARVNSMEIVWLIAPDYVEPDTAQLLWDPNTTYHFREQWGPEVGNSVLRLYRDGALVLTTSVPGVWKPSGHSVRIAASTRRAEDFGAPLGAVFSNVKLWNLSVQSPPVITRPGTNATVNTTRLFVEWLGDPHTRYQVRVNRTNEPASDSVWDSGEVSSDRNFSWAGPLPDGATYYIFVRVGDAATWGPWSARGHSVRVDTTVTLPGANVVHVNGKSLCDSKGPFLGLGASYFQALRLAKFDRTQLNQDLALLADRGFDYVRILTMVNWDGLEIAPVNFTNSAGHAVAAWPDYWQQFRDLLDLVGAHGLRAEVTVFADAQFVMPLKTTRQMHLNSLLTNIAGREQHILHLEVANEAWQNGFPGSQGASDLREFARYLADRTSVPVAITSTADTSDAGIVSLYSGSAADLATVHFTRDIGTGEGGWLPVRDCYRAGNLPGVPPVSSNEPIGPGSSVSSENDPVKLCAAAVFAYIANLPAYVYHSRAGVYGYANCCPPSGGPVHFENTAGINAFRFLRQILPPDLSSWVRNDGIEPSAPFTVFCNGRPNQYWPQISNPTNGCNRNIGSAKANEFVCFPMGILSGGVTLQARRPVQFQVVHPLTGSVVSNVTLRAGASLPLPRGPGAYILKGTILPPGTLCDSWTQFLDGSSLPAAPWESFQAGGSVGTTTIVSFPDPELSSDNYALRINSGSNATEWFAGLGEMVELAAGARFRLVSFSDSGKENLLCLTTRSPPLSPAPAVTLVNGRYKLWSYVSSNTEIMDLGPAVPNQWHTAYLYARMDGKTRLWWDGMLVFDGMAPLANPFNAYVEWGSGAWQYDAASTVDFDWVGYGHPCNLPQALKITPAATEVVLSWPTNAVGFVPQATPGLSPPAWVDLNAPAAVLGSENTLTNPAQDPTGFFRLRKR
jgi:hypothetical protein